MSRLNACLSFNMERLTRKIGIGMGASLKVAHGENEDIGKTAEKAKKKRKWMPERKGLIRSLKLAHKGRLTKLC